MISNNLLAEKSKNFGVRIVKCHQYLTSKRREYMISKQIYRAGTSIGANVHESIYAQSKADFVNKLQVAQKEAGETNYWLYLLFHSDYISEELYQSLKNDCDELLRLLAATIKNSKNSL